MINGYSSYEIQLPEGINDIWNLASAENPYFYLTEKQTEEIDSLLLTGKPIYLKMKGDEIDTIIHPIIKIDSYTPSFVLSTTYSYLDDAETHLYSFIMSKDDTNKYKIKVDSVVIM